MLNELKDKVAVVTGAAGGIGRAIAEQAAAAGMKVVLAGIDAGRLDTVADRMTKTGADVTVVQVDVSRSEEVSTLAEQSIETYGAVHLLCNNAGVSYNSPSSWETPAAAWEWVLGVNLMGVVHGIQSFLPIMLEQDSDAHIVNTASTSGLIMNSYAVPYGVSKHAVVALSESLFLELEGRSARVGVSVLCPGPVDTGIVDASHRNRPAEIPPPDLSAEESLLEEAFKDYLKQGLSPDDVAARVMSAVRENRFYVFTHDYRGAIQTRMNNLLEEQNPKPSPPNPKLLQALQPLMDK